MALGARTFAQRRDVVILPVMPTNGVVPGVVEKLEPRFLLSTVSFLPQQTLATGTNPIAIASADFNGDGNLDLAVADTTSPGEITILLGNGNGTFFTGQSAAIAV